MHDPVFGLRGAVLPDDFVAFDRDPALATAQTESLDLIVLDVMLPDIDGFELAHRLREDGVSTPILFLTARDALSCSSSVAPFPAPAAAAVATSGCDAR